MSELSQEDLENLTQKRSDRCRPVVQEVKKLILDKGLLLSDLSYLESYVKQELDVMLRGVVFQHFNELFNMIQGDMEKAVADAQNELWGKDKTEVSVEDVDKVLKKKKKIPKES